MYLLYLSSQFADRVNEASFLLSIILSALFYYKYRRYTLQMQKDEMIDRFLQ